MRSIDNHFYEQKKWKKVRAAYISKHGLCERCLKKGIYEPAVIVHHREHLNADNVKNPKIAYGEQNLESLCFKCHQTEHFGSKDERRRYSFDKNGMILI